MTDMMLKQIWMALLPNDISVTKPFILFAQVVPKEVPMQYWMFTNGKGSFRTRNW